MKANIRAQLNTWMRDKHPGSQLKRLQYLKGGSATNMLAFDFVDEINVTHTCILRQPNTLDLARDPQAAEHEYTLLTYLQRQGFKVPTPRDHDQRCHYFNTPTLILDYVVGEVVNEPQNRHTFAQQAARYLARLHQLEPDVQTLSFLPKVSELFHQRLENPPAEPDNAMLENRVREILNTAWPISQITPLHLLHGDYWLGNMLWENGQLIAVIDWENAMLGHPLADLAIARLEMLLMFDEAMMRDFTQEYQQDNPLPMDTLSWWELTTVLRSGFRIEAWAAPEDVQGLRVKQRWYFTQALDNLGITY